MSETSTNDLYLLLERALHLIGVGPCHIRNADKVSKVIEDENGDIGFVYEQQPCCPDCPGCKHQQKCLELKGEIIQAMMIAPPGIPGVTR